ncbi:MAG: hypothetical protein VX130_07670 [Verrucomicrobiota bacterium]|nr:hypothetical protein [Verrucomicrobiota bacterium]
MCFLFFGCGKAWDPDHQYQSQIEEIILMNDLSNQKNNEQAELNLIDLESMLRLRLLPGMSINEVSYRLGNNYKILAQTKVDGLIWERRSYLMQDIVKHRFGISSLEAELQKKRNPKTLVITVNSKQMVSREKL